MHVLEFVITSSLRVENALAFPNPMTNETRFFYTLSSHAGEVTIELITMSGLSLKRWRLGAQGAGYHEGPLWRGRDTDGDDIANGTYLMRLVARGLDGQRTEAMSRVSIIR